LKKKANWISDGNYLLSEFFLKILGRSPGGTRQGRSGEWCNGAPQDGITLPRKPKAMTQGWFFSSDAPDVKTEVCSPLSYAEMGCFSSLLFAFLNL